MKNELTEKEMAVVLEAAWFSLRHNYEELAEYLDLSDEELKPLMKKIDLLLNF